MWLAQLGTTTLYIEPGSPWENGYCESFNRKLRDQCLNGEIYGAMMMRWQSQAPIHPIYARTRRIRTSEGMPS